MLTQAYNSRLDGKCIVPLEDWSFKVDLMRKILHYFYSYIRGMDKNIKQEDFNILENSNITAIFGAEHNFITEWPGLPLQIFNFLLKLSNICFKNHQKENRSKYPKIPFQNPSLRALQENGALCNRTFIPHDPPVLHALAGSEVCSSGSISVPCSQPSLYERLPVRTLSQQGPYPGSPIWKKFVGPY